MYGRDARSQTPPAPNTFEKGTLHLPITQARFATITHATTCSMLHTHTDARVQCPYPSLSPLCERRASFHDADPLFPTTRLGPPNNTDMVFSRITKLTPDNMCTALSNALIYRPNTHQPPAHDHRTQAATKKLGSEKFVKFRFRNTKILPPPPLNLIWRMYMCGCVWYARAIQMLFSVSPFLIVFSLLAVSAGTHRPTASARRPTASARRPKVPNSQGGFHGIPFEK